MIIQFFPSGDKWFDTTVYSVIFQGIYMCLITRTYVYMCFSNVIIYLIDFTFLGCVISNCYQPVKIFIKPGTRFIGSSVPSAQTVGKVWDDFINKCHNTFKVFNHIIDWIFCCSYKRNTTQINREISSNRN